MRWEDAPYVKLYRDNGPWMDLSLEARGLFDELLKVVDRAGLLRVGSDPARTVARAVNGRPERVKGYLAELTRDGCVTLCDGALLIRNYVDAQSTRASDKARQLESRLRAKDAALSKQYVVLSGEIIEPVSHVVTHESHDVTHASRSEEKRREENRPEEIKDSPVAPLPAFDFDAVYALYPRKEGRKKGLLRCRSQIKTREKYDALLRAVKNYAAKVQAEQTEAKYVKQFDTFMGCWEDFVQYQQSLAKTLPARRVGWAPAPGGHAEESEDLTDKL